MLIFKVEYWEKLFSELYKCFSRIQQELENAALGPDGASSENPALMSELRALRQRKDELEGHLQSLQDSRRQLMVQLEGLMKLLKVRTTAIIFQPDLGWEVRLHPSFLLSTILCFHFVNYSLCLDLITWV